MDILDRLRQEARLIKSAPFAFVLFLFVGAWAGYVSSTWYYSRQITDRNEQIARYEVALGIKPGSAGALVQLNNVELALKAKSIVASLRELVLDLNAQNERVQKQLEAKEISPKEADAQLVVVDHKIGDTFDSFSASDALNVESELRKRLGPAALSHVVIVPAFTAGDSRVTLMELLRGNHVNAAYIRPLADEIEEMAKLLPR